jgi:hypothetical protein
VFKNGPAKGFCLFRSKQFLKLWLDPILDQEQRCFGIGSVLHRFDQPNFPLRTIMQFMMYMVASMTPQATLAPIAASKS